MPKKIKNQSTSGYYQGSRGRRRVDLQVMDRPRRAGARIAEARSMAALESNQTRWVGWAPENEIDDPSVQAEIQRYLEAGYINRERDQQREIRLANEKTAVTLQTYKA